MSGFYSSIHEVIGSGSETLPAMTILLPLKENDLLITPQGHSKNGITFSHHGNITVLRVLKSFRNTKQQACRTSRRQSCIVSISFSTVFFSRGVYEEKVARLFSCTFTFKVLSWKQIIKKKNKRKIIGPA